MTQHIQKKKRPREASSLSQRALTPLLLSSTVTMLASSRVRDSLRGRDKFQEEEYSEPQESAASKSQSETDETSDKTPQSAPSGTSADVPIGISNKWHNAIQKGEWEKVERLLKKYDQNYYRRKREQRERQKEREERRKEEEEREQEEREAQAQEKSPKSSRRKSVSRMASTRRLKISKYLTGSGGSSDKEIVSPLLERDEEGRTPLHLICSKDAPDKLLLDLILIERHAVSLPDKEGQLPLHVAMKADRYNHVLEKIIRAHPNALKTKDKAGRTPIAYAVELARQRQKVAPPEDPKDLFRWSEPIGKREKDWQFNQEKYWTKVDFLLKTLRQKGKSILPSEHGLILEALECGAPPKVMTRFIITCSKYLRVDDFLAGPAILRCIERQYPLQTLSNLLDNCREHTTIISDSLEKSLNAHYREGCYARHPDEPSFGKELIQWSKGNASTDDNDEDRTITGLTKACQDWWEILKHLLVFCGYGKKHTSNKNIQECNMLHAALSVSSSPPSLLQLLMVLHPKSRTALCPVVKALPIHLACSKWRYDLVRTENDATMHRMMKQLLKADDTMVWVRYRKRLPMHMALAVGQSWSVLKQMALVDKRLVGMRDPQTKLFPFQLAAIKASSKCIPLIIRSRYTPTVWRELPLEEKQKEFKQVSGTQDVRQMNTIFELLKLHPDAVRSKVITIGAPKFSNLDGVGKVASHYLTWCYARSGLGWQTRPENIKILRDAVIEGSIPMPLERWWEDMKSLIRECFPGQKGSIPDSDAFLLHSALYNLDTPPLVIELLLELFPDSAALPLPGTQHYPLHITAGTNAYHPQDFEITSFMDAMQLTLLAYDTAVRATSHGRLPIHVAISKGKTWKELRPLVEADPRTLRIEDPQSGLAPFQVVATFCRASTLGREQSIRFCASAERKIRNIEQHGKSTQERGSMLRKGIRDIQLDSLTTVFELLRREPSTLESRSRGYIYNPPPAAAREKNGTQKSSGKVLPDDYENSGVVLVTHEDSKPLSLAKFFENGLGGSMISLSSDQRSQPTLYSEYSKPQYDDDLVSTMGASATSSLMVSPTSTPKRDDSRGWRSPPCGSKDHILKNSFSPKCRVKPVQIKLPDLDVTDEEQI